MHTIFKSRKGLQIWFLPRACVGDACLRCVCVRPVGVSAREMYLVRKSGQEMSVTWESGHELDMLFMVSCLPVSARKKGRERALVIYLQQIWAPGSHPPPRQIYKQRLSPGLSPRRHALTHPHPTAP